MQEPFTGPRATPAAGDGKICTMGAGGTVSCFDAATGKVLWRHETKMRPSFFTSCSPVIAEGKYIVHIGGLPAGSKGFGGGKGGGGKGDLVAYDLADGKFECPCHESGFDTAGKKLFGPSRRDLDRLDVKLETKDRETQVWVAFQKFQKGIEERKAAE